jgi:hypothetical protein
MRRFAQRSLHRHRVLHFDWEPPIDPVDGTAADPCCSRLSAAGYNGAKPQSRPRGSSPPSVVRRAPCRDG